MLNPSPCSLSAATAPQHQRVLVGQRAAHEQAELVAAEAVGAADARQRGREPAQQRVARGVAEGVVVVLEAVEVEEDERVRTPVALARSRSWIERAAVGQLGQLVGQRLAAGACAAAGSSRAASARRGRARRTARRRRGRA